MIREKSIPFKFLHKFICFIDLGVRSRLFRKTVVTGGVGSQCSTLLSVAYIGLGGWEQ